MDTETSRDHDDHLRIEIQEVCTLEAARSNERQQNIWEVRFEEQFEHFRSILPSSQEIRAEPGRSMDVETSRDHDETSD
jgi:hypothetical protein